MACSAAHGVVAMFCWRCEIEFLPEAGHEFVAHFFPDAHGAVALHIAVTAHRADARALSADLAAQQMQIDDGLHVGDAVLVLREAHRPAGDHPLAVDRDLGGFLNLIAREAGTACRFRPSGRVEDPR